MPDLLQKRFWLFAHFSVFTNASRVSFCGTRKKRRESLENINCAAVLCVVSIVSQTCEGTKDKSPKKDKNAFNGFCSETRIFSTVEGH